MDKFLPTIYVFDTFRCLFLFNADLLLHCLSIFFVGLPWLLVPATNVANVLLVIWRFIKVLQNKKEIQKSENRTSGNDRRKISVFKVAGGRWEEGCQYLRGNNVVS